MSIYVIDASVVIKWFIPEIYSDAARRLLQHDHQYFAPDLLFAETTNAIWKKVRRGELSSSHGKQLTTDLHKIAVETIACRVLATDAYALAIASECTVYDALYLALAVRLEAQMLTADERLVRALTGAPVAASHVRRIQDLRS